MSTLRLHPAGPPGHRGGRSLNSRVFQLAAFALTFILVALLVVTSSRAAFVAQNDNLANTVTSAAVELQDNDGGANAMFAGVTGLVPGRTEVRCIRVTYTGNVTPTEVKLYNAQALVAGDLSDYLNLTIDVGTQPAGESFRSCTGFVSTTQLYTGDLLDFATAHPNYATTPVATGWTPTAGESRVFRFTIGVQDNASAKNKSTTFGFSWETRTS